MGDIVATIQAEQDAIIRSDLGGRPRRPGRPGHRQDGGRAAPRRLPAVRPPPGPRALGRAAHRAERGVPALHRPGAAVARRDRRRHHDDRRARTRASRVDRRRGRGGRARSRGAPRWPASSRGPCGSVSACPRAPQEVKVEGRGPGHHAAGRVRRDGAGPAQPPAAQHGPGDLRAGDARPARRPVRRAARLSGAGGRARRDPRGAADHPRHPGRAQPRVDAADPAAARRGPVDQARADSPPPRPSCPVATAHCCCGSRARRGPPPTCRCSTRRPSCSARTTRPPGPRRAPTPSDAPPRSSTRAGCCSRPATPASCPPSCSPTGSPRPVRRLTTAERAAADRTWTYGHVVVDEAQELSAMAWRMLLRRVPTRSMTIVGDVAQTTARAGARSWRAMLDPILRSSWRLSELTVNYRTPCGGRDGGADRGAGRGPAGERPALGPRGARTRCSSSTSPEAPRPPATADDDALVAAAVRHAAAAVGRMDDVADGGRVAVVVADRRSSRRSRSAVGTPGSATSWAPERRARRAAHRAHAAGGQGARVRRRRAGGAGRGCWRRARATCTSR